MDNKIDMKRAQTKEYLICGRICYDINDGHIGCIATQKIGYG